MTNWFSATVGTLNVTADGVRTFDLYVDDATGSDSNSGTSASAPLRTLAAAYSKISYVVNVMVRIFVAPHGGSGYDLRTFSQRAVYQNVWVIGTGVTVLKATAAAASGSNIELVVSSGLTTDAYRGKTIEILTGAAAGDRRTIRNNTTTGIVPVAFFSASIAENDTYRIVEPSTVLLGPNEDIILASGVSAGTADPISDAAPATPGLFFENVRFSLTNDIAIGVAMVYFFGVELIGPGTLRIFGGRSPGQWKWGTELQSSVPSAKQRGATSATSYLGWGLYSNGILLPSKTAIAGFVVCGNFVCFGGHYEVQGGSVGFLRANGGGNGPCSIAAANHINGWPWLLITGTTDVVRAFLAGAVIIGNQMEITATTGTAVLATRRGIVTTGDDTRLTAAGAGLKATLGGVVEFDSSFDGAQFSAGGNDTEAGQAPVSQALAAYTTIGDFIAEATSDGSVVQRIS